MFYLLFPSFFMYSFFHLFFYSFFCSSFLPSYLLFFLFLSIFSLPFSIFLLSLLSPLPVPFSSLCLSFLNLRIKPMVVSKLCQCSGSRDTLNHQRFLYYCFSGSLIENTYLCHNSSSLRVNSSFKNI